MINTTQRELNKPSELTQVVFFKDDDSNAMASLTSIQMDMLNLIFYKSREYFIKENIELTEFIPFEIDLKTFSKEFGKYQKSEFSTLIKQLDELSNVKVVINALRKNKNMETTFTRFIHKLTVSKHKNNVRKKVRLVLDGEICKMIFDVKKLFTKFYLKIQFSMKSKYSKLLYEILKDYQGVNTKTIDFELLLGLLNVDFENTNNGTWALFNQNIIKKAVKEINEKSDIYVSYEPIKERINGKRLQVTKIKFDIDKQNNERLEELGLLKTKHSDISMDEQILYNKKLVIAKDRLEKAKQFQSINNEEAWLEKTINSITDKELEKIEEEEIALSKLKDIDIKDYTEKLSLKYGDLIGLDEAYLNYVFTNKRITTSAVETLEVLENL